jgi:hypothetical protein
MHGVENRRVFVYVREEKGYREHLEDGGGLPAMPVRIGVDMAQR